MRPHVKRVLQIVIGSLLAVGLVLTALGALLPRRWHVEESIMINAPPPAIHALVDDLRQWPRWAQWNQEALSPRNEIRGPSSGPGASLTWYANGKNDADVTSGVVTIVRSDPALGVWFENRTRGGEPSQASLTYVSKPGVTEVVWQDSGKLPPIVGGLFLDLFQQRLAEHMRGGLERLKNSVELAGRAEAMPPSERR
jgi:hypothetical protein